MGPTGSRRDVVASDGRPHGFELGGWVAPAPERRLNYDPGWDDVLSHYPSTG
jgi:hypothetical protein